MARYTYRCKICNEVFVIECRMADYQSRCNCPTCNELSERDVNDLLPQNYIVNASGFYGKKSN